MENEKYISADDFCKHYHTETTFIQTLNEMGLITITHIEHSDYINEEELQKLEQFARLHYDLNINEEGIEAIHHLLNRVHDLQSEVTTLKNRLRMFNK